MTFSLQELIAEEAYHSELRRRGLEPATKTEAWLADQQRAARLAAIAAATSTPPHHLSTLSVAANDNAPVQVIDPAEWEGVEVPERHWYVPGLIPSRTVTLLSGDGGLGKSLLALQIGIASPLGTHVLGFTPSRGRTLYVGAEDEADEFQRRIAAILASTDHRFSDLAGAFRLMPLADRDAVLAAPDRSGRMIETSLMQALRAEIDVFRPALIVLDTSADLFGGDEIKRSQVRPFVGMLRAIAMEFDCAVLLLSHPSISGMQSGAGTSGSTAWNNSVRSRLYLTAATGEDADPDRRVLTTMKANYGAKGNAITMRWRDGVFVLDDGNLPNPAQSLMDGVTDRLFVELLSKMNKQGDRLTLTTGTSYAPAKMAKHPDAKGHNKRALEAAMRRLLDQGAIKSVTDGPPSRQRSRLWVKAEDFGGS